MKTFNTGSVLKVLIGIGLISGLLNTQLFAAGTDAGDTVANQATISYQVGGVAQPDVQSDDDGNAANGAGTTDFVVDRLIDMTVTWQDGSNVPVTAGQDNSTPGTPIPNPPAVLRFTVQHDGNEDFQDFALTVEQDAGDDFDPTDVSIFVDSNGNDTYEPGTDTATFIDELAEDASISVFVVGSVALTQADGDTSDIHLIATAHDANNGTTGALGGLTPTNDADVDAALTVQNVYGDADGPATADTLENGDHSDTGTYVVSVPLTVAKVSLVTDDPTSSANPKAIPGATVQYSITITNNSATDNATNLSIDDDLPLEMDYENLGAASYVCGPGCVGCGAPSYTAAAQGAPGENVTFSGITVNASTSCTVSFDAIVN